MSSIDLMAVLQACRELSAETGFERLRDRVAEVAGTMIGATAIHLLVDRGDDRGWHVSAAAGEVPLGSPEADRLLPVSAVRVAERTHEPLVVVDAVRDERFHRDPHLADADVCSLLIVPIRPLAMLVLENTLRAGAFDSGRAEVAGLIAGQLAVSLGNALLYESMERTIARRTGELAAANQRLDQLSRTDALTGLANRRDFDDQLLREWKRAARAVVPLAVVLIDVDHFKAYNDRYGHPAGDACLRHVSSVIRRTVRETDVAARFGGEEFALILPGATVAEAWIAAERVRSAVAAAAEPHAGTDAGVVTISLGVGSLVPAAGGEPEKLLEDADLALYEAKREGRNQVRPAINNLSS